MTTITLTVKDHEWPMLADCVNAMLEMLSLQPTNRDTLGRILKLTLETVGRDLTLQNEKS